MLASWQPDRELGELTDFAVDRDRAAVPLGNNLVTDRQAKPRPLAGRLGREEGLDQLLLVLRRNTDAVVAHPDLDGVPQIPGRDPEDWTDRAVSRTAALVGRIEAIADEVQEHAGDVLRHDLDRSEIAIEVALHGYIEALVLRPGAVIG